MGCASVLATQGSFSAVSAGAISGLGNASLRAGQNLSVDAGQGSLVLSPWQTSQLSAGQDLSLTARTGQLKIEGMGSSSDTVGTRGSLTARDMNLQGASVDLLGAALSARRDLRITATEGSVNISALENTPNQGGYANRYMQGADLNAGRDLQITSSGHIISQGLKASAGGDLRMRAAASLDMAGTSNRIDRYDGFWTIRQRQVNTSTLSAGGALALSAGSGLRLDAVKASAGGAMTLNALGNVQLDASQNWTDEKSGSDTKSMRKCGKIGRPIGGCIGEVVAEMFKDQRPGAFAPDSEKSAFNAKVLAYSKLVLGAVAAYACGNAQTAITTSEVAVANNFLTYNRQSSRASQWGSFKRELDSCKVTAGCDVSGVYNR